MRTPGNARLEFTFHSLAWRFILLVALLVARNGAFAIEPNDPYRQALLIGVWNYEHEVKLSPMTADLELLKQAFVGVAFDRVEVLEQTTEAAIRTAFDEMVVRAIAERPTRSVLTVVYFGGHGTMVNNKSYLLAQDFRRPTTSIELIVSGALGVDYFADRMKPVGEPLLLIVDTCRNPFTPATTNVTPIEPSPPDSTPTLDLHRMIGEPSANFGFAAFYATEAGQLVKIASANPTVPPPFVQAIAEVMPGGSEVSPFTAAVRQRVMDATEGSNQMKPDYLDKGGGKLMWFYRELDRTVDRIEWEQSVAAGREDLVRDFIARFLTSRYAVIARQWVEERDVSAGGGSTMIRYTSELRRELGANAVRRVAGNLFNLRPKLLKEAAMATTASMDVGRRVALEDVRMVRRITGDEVRFEAVLLDNEVVEFEGPLLLADPSRLTAFWEDDAVVGVDCDEEEIASGRCSAVEAAIGLMAGANIGVVGTLFVASIAGGNEPDFDPSGTHARMRSMVGRFNAAGLAANSFALRSFSRAELATRSTPILIKRGDGKALVAGEK